MEKYYENEFNELLDLVRNSRDKQLQVSNDISSIVSPLFSLGDDRFASYHSMVDTNEYRAAKAIERIAVELVKERKLQYFALYPIAKEYQALNDTEKNKTRPFQLIIKEEDKVVGVVFCMITDKAEHISRYEHGLYKVDALQIVTMVAPSDENYNLYFRPSNDFRHKCGLAVEEITIQQFWEKHFGAEEYIRLVNYVNDFNEKATEIIGFQTIVTPTDKAIANFKSKIGVELVNRSYIEQIPDNIYSKQIEILNHNYIERRLWRAMIGSSNFALSFITSEWYYSIYQLTENLDLTPVVAGYLKSIEQLLFAIIDLAKGSGITIKSKDNSIIEFTEDTENTADTTLWALEQVIAHNGKILDVNKYVREHLVATVDDWREKHRNGYFHKHNLQSIEKVTEIRERAFQLYFLILGSCTVKDSQLDILGIPAVE